MSKALIGRPVNCHAFRGALVTTYYTSGATQNDMNALAAVMAHDPATARDYYFKADAQKQALEVNDTMREALGVSEPSSLLPSAVSTTCDQPVPHLE